MQRRHAIAERLIAQYYAQYSPDAAPRPLVDGKDVMALGVQQGPRIGQILSAVREAQMIGEINTRAEALALAQRLNASGASPTEE
jgi:DNA-binding SARP family transcriptional activator